VLDEAKAAKPSQAFDVLGRPRDQIIDTDDVMPELDEALTKMRADETSATGNQGSGHDKIESDPQLFLFVSCLGVSIPRNRPEIQNHESEAGWFGF
jgi:hypothetical protein